MKKSAFALFVCVVLLQGCAGKRPAISSPESLIDKSSERVTFSLATPSARQDVTEWLKKDLPSRAEVECEASDGACILITKDLAANNIPVEVNANEGQPKVVLIYERFAARACDNKFRDNSFNPLNRNQPALGCSVASNVVQSVANADQFVNPPMMGNSSAASAVKAVRRLQK